MLSLRSGELLHMSSVKSDNGGITLQQSQVVLFWHLLVQGPCRRSSPSAHFYVALYAASYAVWSKLVVKARLECSCDNHLEALFY